MQFNLKTLALRAAAIRLVAIDVDGVLTDGRLYYSDDGEELKAFHSHDGLGLRRLIEAGIEPAIISARNSKAVKRRMKELGVTNVHLGCNDKGAIVDKLLHAGGLGRKELAAIGDDLLDLPMLKRAGLAVAVADAHPDLRQAADWVTKKPGGRGAVRELCDFILTAQDQK
ncbi:MAG: HAD hydrolase family protein [Gammaproteobacteria bacterium]|nr:HAD hydrolase family protein [Gammaproteobacteria bacterium]